MAVEKQPEPSAGEISETVNDWFRQFLKHFEINFLEAEQAISKESGAADYYFAAFQAFKLTLLDSGMQEDRFRLLIQSAVMAFQQRATNVDTDSKGYPLGYFEATEGSFVNEPLECPPELLPEEREQW